MKSAGKARNNGLYRHIRTSKEIIRNLLNDSDITISFLIRMEQRPVMSALAMSMSVAGSCVVPIRY